MLLIGLLAPFSAVAQEYVNIEGALCSNPPALHCPDADCPTDRVINQGSVVEMTTRRPYFLDYPCDLKPGEPVTFVLSLHGAGSYGNWQRHYFPLLDYVAKHRLVVATPNSPIRVWSEADDAYLENIVDFVTAQIGSENIASFWLAGHSQGGMTANRLLRSDYFSQRVDGWISLSGGRLGGNPGRAASFGPPRPTAAPSPADQARASQMTASFAKAAALLAELPEQDISFIYTTGEREVDDKGVPDSSALAQRYGCPDRSGDGTIIDEQAGYVFDASRQNPPNPAWGLTPASGSAAVLEFSDCRDARVVADVVRLGKGHTEGLEPMVTEGLVELMVSAPGGRMRKR